MADDILDPMPDPTTADRTEIDAWLHQAAEKTQRLALSGRRWAYAALNRVRSWALISLVFGVISTLSNLVSMAFRYLL